MGFLHQPAVVCMVAATIVTWTATIAVTVAEVGSSRLHLTLLAGAVVTGFGLIATLVIERLRDYILEIKTRVLHFDRAYAVAVRALFGGVMDARKDDLELEIESWKGRPGQSV
ncbi:hypothetical protein [Streptosporangium sp. NPDC087985]|uniref:hypothetical protein n=1 Tax=Streptosporangium sp. NPDC087985 TaxID=3366196 RepID=UPI0037F3479F